MKIALWQKIILYGFGLLIAFWLLGVLVGFLRFQLYWWMPRFTFIFWALLLAINVLFALGVMRDAQAQNASDRKTFFVDAPIWGLTVLIGGLFAVIVYWIFHHSTLRRD